MHEMSNEQKALIENFKDCQPLLTAIGDETRQLIIVAIMESGCYPGIRVGEITKKVNLSRPAVSHHIKILMDAKIVNVHKQGTMNFYYLDPEKSRLLDLKILVEHIEHLMEQCN